MTAYTARERVMWAIAILVVLLYALIPVAWIISLSVKPADKLERQEVLLGRSSFENYEAIFKTATSLDALSNSIGIAAIATLISIVLAAMAAYALARLEFARQGA